MKPLVLVILDGWGIGDDKDSNAIAACGCSNFRRLLRKNPHTVLSASGKDVGLPEGQMGNSEVGHLNIGAGRRVLQDLTYISEEIASGNFFQNKELLATIEYVKGQQSSLHLMGLLSDGGVHSHIDHLFALLEMAKEAGLSSVYIHAFLDGRDTPPISAAEYIAALQDKIGELKIGKISTMMGRYYAMDRDKRWDRTEVAYRALVSNEGRKGENPLKALQFSYEHEELDEFIKPWVFTDGKGNIKENDGVIFFNFRPDRARQLTRTFVDRNFNTFFRPENWSGLYFTGFTVYDALLDSKVAFPPREIRNGLGEVLSKQGLKQLRLAETEKYAHVTFFFNGGREEMFPGETRQMVPSPKVATYDLKPEMSAWEVTKTAVEAVCAGKYDVIIMNYANPDMVGHTGDLDAVKRAVKTVDQCLGQLIPVIVEQGGAAVITADHGNAEEMYDEAAGQPLSSHTTNPVPFILINTGVKKLRDKGVLADVAPTVLELLEISQPEEMTGRSLIDRD